MSRETNTDTRIILGVDIDNVLSDTDATVRELLWRRYGVPSVKEQVTQWDYHKCLPISAEQEAMVLAEFHERFCDTVPLLVGAREGLCELARLGQVWLLTGRPLSTQDRTVRWLRHHRLPYDRLIYTQDKSLFAEQLSLLIEDNWDCALAIANKGTPVLLVDRPWNRGKGIHPKIHVVADWTEVVDFVRTTYREFRERKLVTPVAT